MKREHSQFAALRDLTAFPDFHLSPLFISPSRRLIEGPAGTRHLQPQTMLVFLCLAQNEGRVTTRRTLFDCCWGSAPVGDDSLNRALTAIRHTLEGVGAGAMAIETIPRTGYRLVVDQTSRSAAERRSQAVQIAYDCWRSGYPKADVAEITNLEAILSSSDDAHDFGILALLLRKAAEYSDSTDCGSYVERCETAARRALGLNPRDSDARTALAGLAPLFGNWSNMRTQLAGVLSEDARYIPARHELAVLEMATGRPSAAVPLIEGLLADDPYAATFHYKRMYHLWTLGDLNGAEKVAARALQLWPLHPAIWSARFWILIFTNRAQQALQFVGEQDSRPPMPDSAIGFMQQTAEVVAALQSAKLSSAKRSGHVRRCVDSAALGPAFAVSSLKSLCAVDAIDEAFDVARGYYLGQGSSATPLRRNAGDPSITDQHRRVTQPLFIPAGEAMRRDKRFLPLCEDMGLAAYWDEFGIVPDFLNIGQDSVMARPILRELPTLAKSRS